MSSGGMFPGNENSNCSGTGDASSKAEFTLIPLPSFQIVNVYPFLPAKPVAISCDAEVATNPESGKGCVTCANKSMFSPFDTNPLLKT